MKMKLLNFFLIISTASSLCFAKGPGEGGGGFAFSQSEAAKRLKFEAEDLYLRLGWVNESCLNEELASQNLKPVELNKLKDIIRNVRKNYLSSANRINPEGDLEPLIFNYGTDEKGPYIEAQQIFFISYLAIKPTSETNGTIHRDISGYLLHEASHHFGYDEAAAIKFRGLVLRISDSTSKCIK